MFAVIDVPNFGLQSLLRNAPNWGSSSAALLDSGPASASKAIVLECTASAAAAGVCPGLTAPQAMARCRELVLKSRSPAAEQEAANILLQTAYTFTPHIEHTAPGVCTIDLRGLNFISDCHNETHPSGAAAANDETQQAFGFLTEVESLAPGNPNSASPSLPRTPANRLLMEWGEKILAALQQVNLQARIGIAATPNIALLAAQATGAGCVLVVERTEDFFKHLPIEALAPSPQELAILKRWGIHTAGAFLALGKDAIAERLGAESLELFERADTNTIRPLHLAVPPDTFEEHMDFEVQIETLEPLLFVLRRFVEQLATRIALTYRVVAELGLTLTLESGPPHERTFKVPAPTANVDTLFRMLHTHLENLHTDAPIVSLRLSAAPVRSQSQQFGLFESALRDPNHFHETLARLSALLGHERVGTPVLEATHRPDSFQMKTPAFGEGPLPEADESLETQNPKARMQNASGLCLRRFRPALQAEVELEHGQPVFISTLVMSGSVKRARGPWCASGTWWDQRRWSRQEWDVETREGTIYRLFHAEGNWVVEGMYD
jgi:protein ImuB